jgi:hypothetical protein
MFLQTDRGKYRGTEEKKTTKQIEAREHKGRGRLASEANRTPSGG